MSRKVIKKATPAAHKLTLPFPTAEQSSKAVQVVIEALSSPDCGGHDCCCVVNACWVVAGYALSAMGDCPAPAPVTALMSDADRIQLLQQVANHANEVKAARPAGAVPWMLLLDMIYTLIKEWLQSEGFEPVV